MTSAGYLLETFLTLVVVCGVAFGVLYGARRLGLGRPSGPITLVGQLPLDGRRVIYLVRVADQVFVVGGGEGGLTKLGEVAASELPAGAEIASRPFANAFARARGKRTKGAPSSPSSPPSPPGAA